MRDKANNRFCVCLKAGKVFHQPPPNPSLLPSPTPRKLIGWCDIGADDESETWRPTSLLVFFFLLFSSFPSPLFIGTFLGFRPKREYSWNITGIFLINLCTLIDQQQPSFFARSSPLHRLRHSWHLDVLHWTRARTDLSFGPKKVKMKY